MYTVRYTGRMSNEIHIIEAALQEFAARGYSAVGVQEIVDIVGVTKPTLYHYFDGKRGLLKEIIKRKTSGFLQTFMVASEYQHDLTFTLQQILKAVVEFALAEPVFFPYFTALRFSPVDSVEKACVDPIYSLIDNRLRELFIAAVSDHGNLRGKEDLQTATFWGFSVEIASLMLAGKVAQDDDLIYRSLHQYEHGIYS